MNDVPQQPDGQEVPELLTIAEIANRFDVSRQTVHNLRRRGVFPPAQLAENSTRVRFDAVAVAAYFKANPKQPGKKIERRTQSPVISDHQGVES